MSNRQMRIGLKLKKMDTIIIVMVSCLLIFVVLMMNAFTYNVESSQEELIEQTLERMSDNQKQQFESYVDQKMEILRALAQYPEVYEMDDEKQCTFLKGRAAALGFQHFFVVNANGIGYYFDEGIHRNQRGEPFFQNIMSHKEYLTEPFYSNTSPAITTACVSIYNESNEKVGVLCGAINLGNMQKTIESSEVVLDGSCFILNRSGNYISSNTNLDVNSQSSIFTMADSELSLISQAFSKREDASGNIVIGGVEYIAHLSYLEDFNWVMVHCIPVDTIRERFASMEKLQAVMMVLVIGLIGCIIRIIYSWKKSDKKIYTDVLTGCSSRAAALSLLESLEDQRNMRISVVYMDLNKFKYVNDTYGHDKGDKLLRIFGATLNKVFAEIGFVGRMGGDEFIAILSNRNDSQIEELCTEVENILWEKSKQLDFPYIISSSYGYASRNVGQPETLDEILQMADERMYINKASKKDKKEVE